MGRRCDLLIIGGGAGGLVAAHEARRRGATTIMVQDGPVGGDCTFTGCIPSKTLLAAASRGATFTDAMSTVAETVRRIAATEDASVLAREGIEVIDGRARVIAPDTVDVDGTTIEGSHLVIATGSRPALPPIPGLADVSPLTNDELFDQRERPDRLAILGAGPMGVEMAQAFARLGSMVMLVESAERIVPREEPESSAVVGAALELDGVRVLADTRVDRVERTDSGSIRLRFSGGETAEVDQLLVAAGRRFSGAGMGLEEVGVQVDDRGAVVVDATLATSVPGIWAVGDVTGGLALTHVAGRQGWIAASNALAKTARVRRFRFDATAVPWAILTDPEVGRVGLTEAEAAEHHPSARVAHLEMSHVDRAVATGREEGFVKLIAAPRRGIGHLGGGRIVGASVVAPTGGDLVHEAALAMQTGMLAGRLAQTTHAYPSWAMAIQQAALQFFGSSGGGTARPVRP